jgi:hypothetical protein
VQLFLSPDPRIPKQFESSDAPFEFVAGMTNALELELLSEQDDGQSVRVASR